MCDSTPLTNPLSHVWQYPSYKPTEPCVKVALLQTQWAITFHQATVRDDENIVQALYMWQSQKYYSFAYFECITKFDAL